MKFDRSEVQIQTDPDILGGIPVYSGTRLPIETILGALDEGDTLVELQNTYPYLTQAHIDVAREYEKAHPRRGQGRRLPEHHPDMSVERHRVLRLGQLIEHVNKSERYSFESVCKSISEAVLKARAKKSNTSPSPAWICIDCGHRELGPSNTLSHTMHVGICDICHQQKAVTAAEDFGRTKGSPDCDDLVNH